MDLALAPRREHVPLLVLVFQGATVFLAMKFWGPEVWLLAMTLAAAVGVWAWLDALSRARAIRDTPTSRIASAAQGYVELMGIAQALPDTRLLSPMTGLPCLWYRYMRYRRVNDRWELEDQGESDLEFVLDDDSGRCTLDPQGADILTDHKETRETGDSRYTEYVLLAGDRLYAIGQFRSWHPSQQPRDRKAQAGRILSDWKEEQQALHDRFDLDGNGEIDQKEWQLARQAAHREADREHAAELRQPVRHTLGKPRGGRLYLISNHPPDALGRRYVRWAWLHLMVLLGLLAGLGWAVGMVI